VEFDQLERTMDRHLLEQTLRPVIGGLVILVTLMAILGLGIRDPRPHDIPVGIAAPAPLVQQLTTGFGQAAPGAFAFNTFASEAEARAALDERTVVAALVVDQAGPRLMVAGAAGDAISGGVTTAFTNAFRAQGQDLAVETVHPFQAGDPHGIVLFFLVLASIIAAAICGALTAMGLGSRSWVGSVATLGTYAVLAGVTGGLVAAWLADGYGGTLVGVMAVCALLSLAVASVVAAAGRLFGPVGIGLAALAIIPVGLISSGGPLGSEFLPDAYRAVAPWLPVAPAYSALRGALYFDGAALTTPLAVLSAWVLVGIIGLGVRSLWPASRTRTALAHA
jgi:hypothetical protein